jgi:hypothetical protein
VLGRELGAEHFAVAHQRVLRGDVKPDGHVRSCHHVIWSATARADARSMSATTTHMPSAPRPSATPRPIPLPPPITTAVRPASSKMRSSCILFIVHWDGGLASDRQKVDVRRIEPVQDPQVVSKS